MFAKKLALVTAAGLMLSAASTAFADPPYWAPAHGWRAKHQRQVVVVHHRPHYVARPVYAAAPIVVAPPVYYASPAYYAPLPVYGTVYYGGSGLATVGGAVAGAIIGNHFGHGDGRVASTLIGATLGAVVGSRLEYGY